MTISSLDMGDFQAIAVDFNNPGWRKPVPAVPGWYAISTNAPLNVLSSFPLPIEGTSHYKIGKRLQDVQFLIEQGAAIVPARDGDMYIVYSGEHGNLKARAREHECGATGTGCLSLTQYEVATQYEWTFHFRPCELQVPGCEGNKMLRNYLEQRWRAENGWPVLCSR